MGALLQQAGVADLMPLRISKDDATQSKPDPDIVQAALKRAHAPADRTVMIGDTPFDVEAAQRAGVDAIALRCGGHWSDADLQRALVILDDPAALLAYWATETSGTNPLGTLRLSIRRSRRVAGRAYQEESPKIRCFGCNVLVDGDGADGYRRRVRRPRISS